MKRLFSVGLAWSTSFSLLVSLTVIAPNAAFATDPKKDPDEIGNRNVSGTVNFYSLEKEIAIGKGLAQQVEKQAKIINDPMISEYVNRVGQNLVRNSDAKVPFTIKVIDSEEVNAFALPGGFFFVNSGLILKADSEAELAGVMAHEIAHVAARHGTRQATRGEIANSATIPLIIDLRLLDRLRNLSGSQHSGSHRVPEVLAWLRIRSRHAGSANICTRRDTIQPRLWISSKRLRPWRSASRGAWPRSSPLILPLTTASRPRKRTFRKSWWPSPST